MHLGTARGNDDEGEKKERIWDLVQLCEKLYITFRESCFYSITSRKLSHETGSHRQKFDDPGIAIPGRSPMKKMS